MCDGQSVYPVDYKIFAVDHEYGNAWFTEPAHVIAHGIEPIVIVTVM